MFVLYGHFGRIGYMWALFAVPLASVIDSPLLMTTMLLVLHLPIQRNCKHDYWHMCKTVVPDLGLLFGLFAEWPFVNMHIGVDQMSCCYY